MTEKMVEDICMAVFFIVAMLVFGYLMKKLIDSIDDDKE